MATKAYAMGIFLAIFMVALAIAGLKFLGPNTMIGFVVDGDGGNYACVGTIDCTMLTGALSMGCSDDYTGCTWNSEDGICEGPASKSCAYAYSQTYGSLCENIGCKLCNDSDSDGWNATTEGGLCGSQADCNDTDGDVWICNTTEHCGTYGNDCTKSKGSHVSTAGCSNGQCTIVQCDSNYWNLDNNVGNGCEYFCTLSNDGEEICDGTDNDCDNSIDEGGVCNTAERCGNYTNNCTKQVEGKNVSTVACTSGNCAILGCDSGYNNTNGIFSDGCEAQLGGGACNATEICNGIDDDCNNQTDEGGVCNTADYCGNYTNNCTAIKGAHVSQAGCLAGNCAIAQCDSGWSDTNGNLSDGCENQTVVCIAVNETCNGLDDDCDGVIDNGLNLTTFYRDFDGDKYGSPNYTIRACAAPPGYTSNSLDCNNNNPVINPNATEICTDLIDNNCNGLIDDPAEGCGQQANQTLQDQMTPTPTLGNGVCESGETSENAAVDCGCPPGRELIGTECRLMAQVEQEQRTEVCGNSIVEGTEQCDSSDDMQCPGACSADCTCGFLAGDGVCDKAAGETSENSPEDCAFKFSGMVLLLSVLGIVGGSAGGVVYFKIRPKEKLSDMAEMHDLTTPEALPAAQAPASIESFINQTMSEGFSTEQIRATLVGKGWDADIVDEKLSAAGADLTKLHAAADARGVGEPHEDISKVEKYVDFGLKEGYDPVQIKTALLSSGWDEQTIENVFAEHKGVQADLNKIAKETDISEPSPENAENIKEFAKKGMKKGHTLKQIKGKLKDEGWNSAMINAQLPNV